MDIVALDAAQRVTVVTVDNQMILGKCRQPYENTNSTKRKDHRFVGKPPFPFSVYAEEKGLQAALPILGRQRATGVKSGSRIFCEMR
jgi:hypothetical protein